MYQLQPSIINQGWSSSVNNHQLLLATIHQISTSSRTSSIPYMFCFFCLSKGCEGNQGEVAAHWTATGRNRIINSWSTILGASWIVGPRIDQALCAEPWYDGFPAGKMDDSWCFSPRTWVWWFCFLTLQGFFLKTKPPGWCLKWCGTDNSGSPPWFQSLSPWKLLDWEWGCGWMDVWW